MEIKGYRELSPEDVVLINSIKDHAEAVGALVQKLEIYHTLSIDKRWVAIARTQLQQGFMALTRSVAQPTTF